jgi:hypothetical protein
MQNSTVKVSPGPGSYKHDLGSVSNRTFSLPTNSGFGSSEIKKVGLTPSQMIINNKSPGPQEYQRKLKEIMPSQSNWNKSTWQMMSKTTKGAGIIDPSIVNNPSSTQYNIEKFNTIENPFVSGGSPNNPLTMIKYKNSVIEKANNPFKFTNYDPVQTLRDNTANLGPGMYSIKYPNEIGEFSVNGNRNKSRFM